ncbi:MAG: 16S rRNA (cytidine(1402)-2'-O)-methyltransferase [Candidatus Komeilibacteria bacterium]|nr:16S rRNA (cytidine(1402)-2'-O)-methyltransferase [Candidatus Komeilibacteria bacterium]
MSSAATLFVVGTPIGNLSDISERALQTLREVDFIACEDKRVSTKLLQRYEITTPLLTYFQHSGRIQVERIILRLTNGESAALITDAGTPGISDPGGKLVAAAVAADINVVGIPGPSAATLALSISGLPTDEYVFYGFLPHKKGRQTKLKEIISSQRTAVLYESVHRIEKLLNELIEFGAGDRAIVVGRELTKQFESVYRGSAVLILEKLQADKVKGEFVLVIAAA